MAKPHSTAKAPAFRFYPKDFLTSERQVAMSAAAAGIYIRLMCHCWLSESLPSDPSVLAKMSGADEAEFAHVWPSIESCFTKTKRGRFVHPRLEHERKKQEDYAKSQRTSGLRGAKSRWGRHSEPTGVAIDSPMAKNSSSFSFSSSFPSSSPKKKNSLPKVPADPRIKPFIEWFQLEYQARRFGADYLVAWQRDAPLVKRMLAATDVERLQKLAQILLSEKTDDPFIVNSDRGIQMLSTKFNWLSDRLAAWEAKQQGRTA